MALGNVTLKHEFSLTFVHTNNKNEIRQHKEEEGKTRRVNMERSTVGMKKVVTTAQQ